MPRKLSCDKNKTKEWERERRERLNECFNHLGVLLPDYDPSLVTSKADILQKAASYIRDLQQENRNLLNGGLDESSLTQLTVLKLRVEELVKRTQQLATLLRDAGITIPTETTRAIGQRPNHWTNKINPQDADSLLEKVQKKRAADKMKKAKVRKKKAENIQTAKITSPSPTKKKPLNSTVLNTSNIPSKLSKPSKKLKRTKSKKNTCENLSVPLLSTTNDVQHIQTGVVNTQVPQSYIVINNSSTTSAAKSSPCFVMSNSDAKSSISLMMNQTLPKPQLLTAPIMATRIQTCQSTTIMSQNPSLASLGPGTLILANGSILPVLPQSQTVLTPVLMNNAPRTQSLFVMQNAAVNDSITTATLVSSRTQRGIARLFPKRPVRKDITKTTYANKVPIPSLASMQYFVEKSLEDVAGKSSSPTKVNKKSVKKKAITAVVEGVTRSVGIQKLDSKKAVLAEEKSAMPSIPTASLELGDKTVVPPLIIEEHTIRNDHKDATTEVIKAPVEAINKSDDSVPVSNTINKCDTNSQINLGKRQADDDCSIVVSSKQLKLVLNTGNSSEVLGTAPIYDSDSSPKVLMANKSSSDVSNTVVSNITKTSNSGSYTIDALCKLKIDNSSKIVKDVEVDTTVLEKENCAVLPNTGLSPEVTIHENVAVTDSSDLLIADKSAVAVPPAIVQQEIQSKNVKSVVSSSCVVTSCNPHSNFECIVSREKRDWSSSIFPTYTQAKTTNSKEEDSAKPSSQEKSVYSQNKVPASFSSDNMFFKSSSSINYFPPVSSTNTFTSISHFENNSFMPIPNDTDNVNVHSSLSLAIQNHEFSNDIFASLQVPSGGQHPESISPTAAFLLAFPLVSTSKVTEMIDAGEEAGSDSLQGTATLLQIGNIDSDQGNIISCVPRSLNNTKETSAHRFTGTLKLPEADKVLLTSRIDDMVFSEFGTSKKVSGSKQNIFEYDNCYSGIIPPISAPDSFLTGIAAVPKYETKSKPNQFDSSKTNFTNVDTQMAVASKMPNRPKFLNLSYSQGCNIGTPLPVPTCSNTFEPLQKTTQYDISNADVPKSMPDFVPNKFMHFGVTSCSASVLPEQKSTQNNISIVDIPNVTPDISDNKFYKLQQVLLQSQNPIAGVTSSHSVVSTQTQTKTDNIVANVDSQKSSNFAPNKFLNTPNSQSLSMGPTTYLSSVAPTQKTASAPVSHNNAIVHSAGIAQETKSDFTSNTFLKLPCSQNSIPAVTSTASSIVRTQVATQHNITNLEIPKSIPDLKQNNFLNIYSQSTIPLPCSKTQTQTTVQNNFPNMAVPKLMPEMIGNRPKFLDLNYSRTSSMVPCSSSVVPSKHTSHIHAPGMDVQQSNLDFTQHKFVSYAQTSGIGTSSGTVAPTQTIAIRNNTPNIDIQKSLPDLTPNKFLHLPYSQTPGICVTSNSSLAAPTQKSTMQNNPHNIDIQKSIPDYTASNFLNLPYSEAPDIRVTSSTNSALPTQRMVTPNTNLFSKDNPFLMHSSENPKTSQQLKKIDLADSSNAAVQIPTHSNYKTMVPIANCDSSKYSVANISSNISETKTSLYSQPGNLHSEPYNYNLFNNNNPVITTNANNYSNNANDKAFVSHNSSTIQPWTSFSATTTSNTNQFVSVSTSRPSQESGSKSQSVSNALPGIHEIYVHKTSSEELLIQKPETFTNIFGRSNENVQFHPTQNLIQDAHNYKYHAETKSQPSTNPMCSKSQNHSQRPPVNWMTTPDSRQQIFTTAPNQSTRVHPITTPAMITEPPQKLFEICTNQNIFPSSNAPTTNFDTRNLNSTPFYGNNLYPSNSTNHCQDIHHEPQQRNTDIESNESYPFNWNQSPRKNPFSTSSAVPDINSSIFVPSTLPTLVGDLALGTNFAMNVDEHNKSFVQSYDGDKSADEQRRDKLQKPNEKESKARKTNEYQSGSHLLSVSRLVDQAKSAVGTRAQAPRRNNRNAVSKSTSQRQQPKRFSTIEDSHKTQIQVTGVNYQSSEKDSRGLFNPDAVTPNYQTFQESQNDPWPWTNPNVPQQTRTQYKAPVSNYSAEALIGPSNNLIEINKSRDPPKVVTLPPPMVSERFSHQAYNQRVPPFTPDILQSNYFPSVETLPHQDVQTSNTNFHNQNYSQTNFHTSSSNMTQTAVTTVQNLYSTTYPPSSTNFLMDISSNTYPTGILTPDHNYIFPPTSLPLKNAINRAPRPNLTYSTAAIPLQCAPTNMNQLAPTRQLSGANASQQNCLKQKVRRRIPDPIVSTSISSGIPDIGYLTVPPGMNPPGMNHTGMNPCDEYAGYSQHNPVIYSSSMYSARSGNKAQHNQVATLSAQHRTAQQATASPNATNASSSLTNFNLSTIFPEINDKQVPPPSTFNIGPPKNSMPPPSNSQPPPPGQVGTSTLPPPETYAQSSPQVCRMQWS